MKYITLLILIILSNNYVISCDCSSVSLNRAIKTTDMILVGKIIGQNENSYQIKIIKEWKTKLDIKNSDTISIKRYVSNCSFPEFQEGFYYLLFINNNSVSICSRTHEFSLSKDIKVLDNKRYLKKIFYNSAKEYDSLIYAKKYIIREFNNRLIDVKGKNVVYIFKDKIIRKKDKIPLYKYRFISIRFHLIENINIANIDYIFYIDDPFEETKIEEIRKVPELSQKMIKKIMKK